MKWVVENVSFQCESFAWVPQWKAASFNNLGKSLGSIKGDFEKC